MDLLEKKLGKAISTKEIAKFLGIDAKTARKYYKELGGIRIGRHYRFFEMEVFNAIQTWNEIYRTDKEEWKEAGEGFQDQKAGTDVGSGDEAKVRRRVVWEDKHNLLN